MSLTCFSVKPVFTVGARPVSVFSKSRSTDSPVCKHGRQKKDAKQDLLYNAAKEEQLKILQVNLVVLMLVSLASANAFKIMDFDDVMVICDTPTNFYFTLTHLSQT